MLAEHLVHSHHRLSLHNFNETSSPFFFSRRKTAADVENAFMMFMRGFVTTGWKRRVVNKTTIVSKSALAKRNQLLRLSRFFLFHLSRVRLTWCTYPSSGRSFVCAPMREGRATAKKKRFMNF